MFAIDTVIAPLLSTNGQWVLTISNINEVIRAVLNFFFFLRKDFTRTKSTKRTKSNKSTKSTKSTERHKDTQAKAQACK